MPRGDRTGPAGQGPRSGRGAGYCSGSDVPGFTSAGGGNGLGRAMGGSGRAMGGPGRAMGDPGRAAGGQGYKMGWRWSNRFTGWCRGFWQNFSNFGFASRRDEIDALQQDAAELENELGLVKSRIEELESDKQEQEN